MNLGQDLRYAIRLLARDRGFTAVAVGSLALAIGVNAVVFSVVDTVLLKPFPYRDQERLVFGFAPALKAARLDPVVALASE